MAFALSTPDQSPGAAMSGTARPLVLDRFATLAEAMRGAIALADQMDSMRHRKCWRSLIVMTVWFWLGPLVL